MNNVIKNKNDIFVATLSNPQASTLDLIQSDINPGNTGFLSMDEYKDTNLVKKTFTDDKGIFNEDAFNQAYVLAGKKYQELTDNDVLKRLEKEIEYSPVSRFKPIDSKTYDVSPQLSIVKNPYDQQFGIDSLFGKTPSNKSIRELAQNNKIWDTKNQKWINKTPNELGIFGSIFSEPLVYAQWEEDGMHLDKESGREVLHKKGEYKTDDNGKFFTETLNGREIYGKQIVAASDTLTKEGTWLNSIDFFDSDGLEKSTWGTTFKIGSQIAPYLIPGFNVVWGGITASLGLASIMPTFYKALDGIFTGNENLKEQNSLWKGATNAENWFSKFNNSFSDESQSSLFNYEQLGTMVGDIFSQIYQQRAAASLSKLIKSTDLTSSEQKLVKEFTDKYTSDFLEASAKGLIKDPKAFYSEMIKLSPAIKAISERQSKLAKSLSLSYMALTSTADIYGDAVQNGFDRRSAGIAALLAAGGQYGIMMNNELGSWFLDKTTGYNEKYNRQLMKKALRPYYDDIEKAVSQINKNKQIGKISLGNVAINAKKSINSVFNAIKDGTESYWGNAGIEAIEEMTEEAVLDGTKGVMDAISWLGWTKKQGSFNTIDNIFSEKGFERYITSGIGGFVGGALFKANEKFENKLNNNISPEDKVSLIHEIANGNTDQLLKEAEKFRKIGNTKLSSITTNVNGEEISSSSDGVKSQADDIADGLINYIKYVDGIINQEKLKLDDQSIFEKALLNNVMIPMIEDSGIHKIVLSDFNNIVKEIVDIRSNIDDLKASNKDADTSELESKLLEKQKEVESLLNGEKFEDYLLETLFYLRKDIHEPFSSLDIDSFSKHNFGNSYYSFPKSGEGISQESIKKEYEKFVESTDVKDYLKTKVKAYRNLQELFSPSIKEYHDSKYGDFKRAIFEKIININSNSNLPETIKNSESKQLLKLISEASISGGGENLSLEGLFNIKPSEWLISNDLLNLNEFDQESQEKIKVLLDETMRKIPISNWNSSMIQESLDYVKNVLQNITNNYNSEQGLPDEIIPELILQNPNVDINFNKEFLLQALDKESELDYELVNTLKSYKKEDLFNFIETLNSNLNFQLESGIYGGETIKDALEYSGIVNSAENSTIPAELMEIINKSDNFIDIINNIIEFVTEKATQLDVNDPALIEGITKALNNSYTEQFKQYDSIFSKSTKNNPIYDLLRKLELTIDKDVEKSIFNILEEESNFLKGLSSIDNYIRQGYTYDSIIKGLNTLKMAKGIVYGMETSTIDIKNPFGFNQTIRNYLTKHKEGINLDNYQELNSDQAYLINKEFDQLISKLEFLKNLSDSNSISKADEQRKSREKFNTLILDKLQNSNLSLGSKSLVSGIENIISQKISDEEKLQKIEVIMFDNFKEAVETRSYKEVLKSILTNFNFEDMLHMNSYGISPEMDKISDYDFMVYIATNIAQRSDYFNLDLKNIIIDEKFDKAPFFGQEYGAKIANAMYLNPKLFSDLQDVIFENSNDEIYKQIYGSGSNIFFLNGISGAGKTSVSGQYAIKNILNNNPDSKIIISAPGQRQIETLETSLKSSMTQEEISKYNIFSKTRKELFDLFLEPNENGESIFDIIQNSVQSIDNRQFIDIKSIEELGVIVPKLNSENIKFNQKLKNSFDKPNVIFIDEITHFNKIELELLNLIAKEFNIAIFTFGDTYQKGAKITLKTNIVSDVETHIDQMFVFKAPKLKMSVRPSNIHKKDNAIISENLIDQLLSFEKNKSIDERIPLELQKLSNLNAELKYYENDNILHGDKIVNSLRDEHLIQLKNAILETRKEKPNSKLGILNQDGKLNDDFINKLESLGFTPDMYKVYGTGSYVANAVQGAEEDYFIIDGIKFENLPSDTIKSIYTYTGRALIGSIVVDSEDVFNKLNIKNVKEKITNEYKLDKNIIDKVKDERIKYLNLLTENVKKEKVVPENAKNESSKLIVNALDEIVQDESIDDLSKEMIEIKHENITTFPIEYTESKSTPFHYMGHLFYNHISAIEDSEKGKYKLPENKNKFGINIIDQPGGTEINELDVTAFIRFKNLLSLYNKNSKSFRYALESDDQILNFLRKTNINIDKDLSNEKFVEELLDKNIFGNIVITAKRFNSYLDGPAKKQNLKEDEVLNHNDIFLTISQEINTIDGIKYISIAALPKLETILKNPEFDFNSETYIEYENFIKKAENKLNINDTDSILTFEITDSPESNKNKKINPDKHFFFDFLSGIRLDENNDGYFDISELYKMGINIEEAGIIGNKNDKDGNKEFFTLLNRFRDVPLSEEEKSKMLDSNGKIKARGRGYIIVNFTNDLNEQFKKLIILTPKIKTFDETLSLYETYSPKKDKSDNAKYQRNSLMSSTDQIKMLFALNKEWFNTGDNNISFKNYIDSLIGYVTEKNKTPNIDKIINFLKEFSEFVESGKSYEDFVNEDSNLKLNYKSIKNLGGYILGHILYTRSNYSSEMVNVYLYNTIHSILSNPNGMMENKYYSNPSPIKTIDTENKAVAKLNADDLEKHFHLNVAIEMPRVLINLKNTIKSNFSSQQINSKPEQVISAVEEVRGDKKFEKINNFINSINNLNISDDSKNLLISLSDKLNLLDISINNNEIKFEDSIEESVSDLQSDFLLASMTIDTNESSTNQNIDQIMIDINTLINNLFC